MTQAIRQAISRFARLFGALTGAFSGQETQNHTRAKVLLSAIIHTLADPTLKSQKYRETKSTWKENPNCENLDEDHGSVGDSEIFTSNMKRKLGDSELLPCTKLAKVDTLRGIVARKPAALHSAGRSKPDQVMDALSTKLASSFYALCVAPGSENCQRMFLKRHIMVTLALLRRGQSPGALAAEWADDVTSFDSTDSSDCSDFEEDLDHTDFEKRPEPTVILPISKAIAVSAVLFALEVRNRIKLSLLEVF